MVATFSKVGNAINRLQNVWTKAMSALGISTENNSTLISGVLNGVIAFIGFIAETAMQIVVGAISIIATTIGTIVNVIADVVNMIAAIANGDWAQAWDSFKNIFTDVVDGIKSYFDVIIGGIIDKIGELGSAAKRVLHIGGDDGGDDGGDGNWTGTQYFPGGVTWLHEQGPELVELPTGTKVIPHSESLMSMYNQGRKDSRNGNSLSVSIPKIADQIIVREDADIDRITNQIAFKIKAVAFNQMA